MMTDASAFDDLLDAALVSADADFGNIQVVDLDGPALVIVAQRGFSPAYLRAFARIDMHDESACGRAWRSRQRVSIPDVQEDPAFAPHRAAAFEAGYRAVQATPMISRRGVVMGVLSTHFRRPHRLGVEASLMLELYARIGAAYIESANLEESVNTPAESWSFETAIELVDAIAKLKECARHESPTRCEALARSVCRLAETRVSGLITASQRRLELF